MKKDINCEVCNAYCDFSGTHYAEKRDCIPYFHVRQFGEYTIPKGLRRRIYEKFPEYTVEHIVGTYLGVNPNFPYVNRRKGKNRENDKKWLKLLGF